MVTGDLINEFVDVDVVKAMDTLLSSNDIALVRNSAKAVMQAVTSGSDTSDFDFEKDAKQLLSSFQKNTVLLVQKTWVEKDDVSLKEQVLYKLEQLCAAMENGNWSKLYPVFREIIIDIVYLMFGAQSKNKDFDEYALRIDPEFGIFWWYFSNLPENVDWSDEKCNCTLLIGIAFLANY